LRRRVRHEPMKKQTGREESRGRWKRYQVLGVAVGRGKKVLTKGQTREQSHGQKIAPQNPRNSNRGAECTRGTNGRGRPTPGKKREEKQGVGVRDVPTEARRQKERLGKHHPMKDQEKKTLTAGEKPATPKRKRGLVVGGRSISAKSSIPKSAQKSQPHHREQNWGRENNRESCVAEETIKPSKSPFFVKTARHHLEKKLWGWGGGDAHPSPGGNKNRTNQL